MPSLTEVWPLVLALTGLSFEPPDAVAVADVWLLRVADEVLGIVDVEGEGEVLLLSSAPVTLSVPSALVAEVVSAEDSVAAVAEGVEAV